jgi:transcription elongation factor GreA
MTTMAQVPSERRSAITREGYEQLCDELTALTTTSRAQISDRLRDAREQGGEFADNLELIDALEDQEFLERRITTLEAVLATAHVVDHPPRDGTVGVGSRVRLRDIDSGNTTEYLIVGSIEADPVERKLSSESPVGRALLGRRAGDILDVDAPRGTMRFRILDVHKDARRARRRTAIKGARAGAVAPAGRTALGSALDG